MKPNEFVAKWRVSKVKERSAAQSHFNDLCSMLGEAEPNAADPTGEHFAFEKGANKQLGGTGWADVWKRGCFAMEYKGKHGDLDKAYKQLQQYRESLLNPPLLITCDIDRIVIHTNFTNTVKRVFTITLSDIEANDWTVPDNELVKDRPERAAGIKPLEMLRLIFHEYEADKHPLRSETTTEAVTTEAAKLFGAIANDMRKYDEGSPQEIAHFLIRVLFCLFAEDVGLLPRNLFRTMIEASKVQPKPLAKRMRSLFAAMREGGTFGNDEIKHFNGGLFDSDNVLELESEAMLKLHKVSELDWSAVEPSIFGTLFERGLDPAKRAQLGAHYTSRADIELIVEPVLMQPLRREWEALRTQARALAAALPAQDPVTGKVTQSKKQNQQLAEINSLIVAFQKKLAATRVLDPACGSGNFLYVALRALLTLEKELIALNNELGLPRIAEPGVSPAQLFGIEKNEYAHELAQATVWIGYIQWRNENGFGEPPEPILRKLDNIKCMDAILDLSDPDNPREPEWPEAEVIIGNPPFLGGNKLRQELGDDYVEAMFRLYRDRIPGFADLVCYWFERSRAQIESQKVSAAGLIATNSISEGTNRKVLERIKSSGDIFLAWKSKDWVLDGAAVDISIVGFDAGKRTERRLDGVVVNTISTSLENSAEFSVAFRLDENANIAFIGDTKKGKFDISASEAESMLRDRHNPNGRENSEVVKPWINGLDLARSSRQMWIIDFGVDMNQADAAQFEKPFEYVRMHVKPERDLVRNDRERRLWWIHGRSAPEMRRAIAKLKTYIATSRIAKHRLFVFVSANTIADGQVVVIARDDPYFLGCLQSVPHLLWSLKLGTTLEDRPRYSQTMTFETFPFPWPPGKEPKESENPIVKAIADAARELVTKRDRWLAEGQDALDPAYLTGLNATKKKPKKSEARTLTNLYNQRPTWLDLAHKKLDAAVFAAYGWPADLSDEQILERLLALNLERAKNQPVKAKPKQSDPETSEDDE